MVVYAIYIFIALAFGGYYLYLRSLQNRIKDKE